MKIDGKYPRAKVLGILQSGHRILVEEFVGEHSKGNGIYYRPIGGSIEFGENSTEALKREFREEVKETVAIEDYLGCIENIFRINGRVGHEIILIYRVSFEEKDNYSRNMFMIEECGQETFAKWVDMMDFVTGEKVLFPEGLVEKLERGNS